MGANGHIRIWRDDEVREVFPDCEELFYCLPSHYCSELDGIKYHYCYVGDNIFAAYYDENDWYCGDVDRDRLRQFMNWLQENGTKWEVWT